MANNEGTPLHGDRSAWNTVDFPNEHARDIQDSLFSVHSSGNRTSGAPTVNDDSSEGYVLGSIWWDTNTNFMYMCTDPTEGAAVWGCFLKVDTPSEPFVRLNLPGDESSFAIDGDVILKYEDGYRDELVVGYVPDSEISLQGVVVGSWACDEQYTHLDSSVVVGYAAAADWGSAFAGVNAPYVGYSTVVGNEAATSTRVYRSVVNGCFAGSEASLDDSIVLGYHAGTGCMLSSDVVLGYYALYGGSNAVTSTNSVVIGHEAVGSPGSNLGSDFDDNVIIGHEAAKTADASLQRSVIIGSGAGYNAGSDGSVMIGYQAGYNCITDNRLYIGNSNSPTPLIYGEFDNNLLIIKDTLGLRERSSDPTYPAEGIAVMWLSDGTELGDDGDVLLMTTAGGVTKTCTLCDFSGASAVSSDALLLETGDYALLETGANVLLE
jgi:hypothetical protein